MANPDHHSCNIAAKKQLFHQQLGTKKDMGDTTICRSTSLDTTMEGEEVTTAMGTRMTMMLCG
jgi:hypothetical protein